MATAPLRIALLWHQHQPYYKIQDEFVLPWVRLHGVKDYADLALIAREYPTVKQSMNVVPSLLMQLNDYVHHEARDAVQRLSLRPATALAVEEKRAILDMFFLCNVERMITPYRRYQDLYQRARNPENAIRQFSAADWRDLQVWYNLTWVGPVSRQRPELRRLFEKGESFSEADKTMLLRIHDEILSDVLPVLRSLSESGQFELSVSPLFHPILPLLCDSEVARVAMPDMTLPAIRFAHPEDALAQIEQGLEYFQGCFGHRPRGMWPSEGSVSDDALALMAGAGLDWAATDEQILQRSLGAAYRPTDKYFPQRFHTDQGAISMFFRDHALSDAIGFEYASWEPVAAAHDFCGRLRRIRETIVSHHGPEALQRAVVPVILDGENCWEYYQDNGAPFLRALFQTLATDPDFTTMTFGEVAAEDSPDEDATGHRHIFPGSWINANFKIWIGHSEDNLAWRLLAIARRTLDVIADELPLETYREALQCLMIAEGSDWYWWFGDEHESETDYVFDQLFRWYIEQFYRICDLEPPELVHPPIKQKDFRSNIQAQTKLIEPRIDGRRSRASEWEGAGRINLHASTGTMHQAVDDSRVLWIGAGERHIYLRIDFAQGFADGEKLEINFLDHDLVPGIIVTRSGIEWAAGEKAPPGTLKTAVAECAELALPLDCILPIAEIDARRDRISLRMQFRFFAAGGQLAYPAVGSFAVLLLVPHLQIS